MQTRHTYLKIWAELSAGKRMIFLSGPRQAGKTTLSQIISEGFTNYLYLNWDIADHRSRFIQNPTFFEAIERKDASVHFIKNKEQQEVDFVIANEGQPLLLIEAKYSEMQPSAALKKFQHALQIPAVQLISSGETYRLVQNGGQRMLIAPSYAWLSGLP